MKKFTLVLFLMSLSIGLFAQSTPVSDLRVTNATTIFGINLPVGTKVYNIADGKYWVATAGVLGTSTLTTGAASFKQLNADFTTFVTLDQTAAQTIGTAGNRLTNLWATDLSVTNLIGGSVSGTAANVTGVVAVVNGGTGLPSLEAGSYMIGAGTSNVTFKTPALVLTDIGAAPAASASLFKVESFSEGTTGATGQDNALAQTPKVGTSVLVILNGSPLLASQFTVAAKVVKIMIPVYQYDAVTISYGY